MVARLSSSGKLERKGKDMLANTLYPLQFEPIFKSALWGGNRLRPLFGREPVPDPIGEAWLLSDQGSNQTPIINGHLAGKSLRDLMHDSPAAILGYDPHDDIRFPLLLKMIDARQPLSVQVHPNDEQAKQFAAEKGQTTTDLGKTEAWVVLDTEENSEIYTGLKTGVSKIDLEAALQTNRVAELLNTYQPRRGDCIFLEAGTVHAIGAGMLLFEVQQTSDITYRLYDWGRVDAKTGLPRTLHIEESIRCTDFQRGPCRPINPWLERNGSFKYERLVKSHYFHLHRWISLTPFRVGSFGECRMVVCIEGAGRLVWNRIELSLKLGDAVLLPACISGSEFIPSTKSTVLEIGIPKPVRYET
jgi:mannose-6-phosphate isomerase